MTTLMTGPENNEQACDAIVTDKAQLENNPQAYPTPSNLRKLVIIIAAFMLNFSGCGLLFSFGLYQSLYEDMSQKENNPFTGASSAEISLIGSIAAALMKLGAPYVVAWCKYFSPQRVVCAGGIIYGVASVLASFGKELWHFQLTQGLLVGIGTCLSFMPSMAVPPSWFGKYRGLNMGIISAGTGIGGLVWSPIVTACLQSMGFRNTLRLTGCLCTLLICLSGAVLSWDPKMAAKLQEDKLKKSSSWVSGLLRVPLPPREIILTRKFVAQSLNAIFQSAAYYTPIFYIAAYSKTLGYSDTEGSNFTALSNACNAIGKVGVGFVADKIGRLDAFFLTTLLSSVSTAGLWAPSTLVSSESSQKGLFIGFTILYGLFASAYIGLFSPALVELFGLENMPRITGIMYFMQGAAGFVGTPVAGVLVGSLKDNLTPKNYLHMAIFVGALMVASTVTVFWGNIEDKVERRRKPRNGGDVECN